MTLPTIIELDMGNSAIKWRRLEGGVRQAGGRVETIAELAPVLSSPTALVRVASVADASRDGLLAEFLSERGLAYRFAESQQECAGVKNAYREVSRMGVDRWLAMLAAFQDCRRRCVVIDAGTALTIDILDGDGEHLGGYIIPGARLMAAALGSETGRVRFAEESLVGLQPGLNTEECVHHGKWLALAGGVALMVDRLQAQWSGGFEVYLSGGDAAALRELMPQRTRDWHYREELVMDGLALALAGDGEV